MKGHPIFAAVYGLLSKSMEEHLLGPIRRELLEAVQGNVLDVGAGLGANVPYFSPQVRLVALEPDPFMRRRAQSCRNGSSVEWVDASAETMPFPDGHFDAVVATLALCSVQDPHQSLAEMYRVLRPAGRLIFIEHVISTERRAKRVQQVLTPVWKRVAAGCHLNRDTLASIQDAGFVVDSCRTKIPMPIQPIVYGIARKPAE